MSVYTYKVVFLGNHGVGKTSLFRRIKEDVFDPETVQATAAGIDTCKYETQVGNDKIIVNLWDTGGAERFRTITDAYYRESVGAILVFSLDSEVSCRDLREWLDSALDYMDREFDDCSFAVFGNKCDLEPRMVQSNLESSKVTLSSKYKIDRFDFLLTSAKTGQNVKKGLEKLVVSMHQKSLSGKSSNKEGTKTTIRVDMDTTSKKKCC